MNLLTFSDGETFDLSRPLRVTKRDDEWYVVGENMLIQVRDRAEAVEFIKSRRTSE